MAMIIYLEQYCFEINNIFFFNNKRLQRHLLNLQHQKSRICTYPNVSFHFLLNYSTSSSTFFTFQICSQYPACWLVNDFKRSGHKRSPWAAEVSIRTTTLLCVFKSYIRTCRFTTQCSDSDSFCVNRQDGHVAFINHLAYVGLATLGMSGKRRTVFTQNNLPETVRYHGVFLDDSRGIPVVDVDRSAVVVLFGRTDGYIWTDRQRTNVFFVKSQHWVRIALSASVCRKQNKTKQKRRHKPVYFPLATAWETNCYGKTLNRQLSAVSVHKKSRDLCESGNKTVKCWRERRNNIPLSDIHRNSMFKVSFYKPQQPHAMWCHGRHSKRMTHLFWNTKK